MDEQTRNRFTRYCEVLEAAGQPSLDELDFAIRVHEYAADLIHRDLEKLGIRGRRIQCARLANAIQNVLRRREEWLDDFVYRSQESREPWDLLLSGNTLRRWLTGYSEPLGHLPLVEKSAALSLIRGPEDFRAPAAFHKITRYPYQVRTVARFLHELDGSGIVADEAGLGKTIEAGILIEELHHQGVIRNCLILTPASLVEQWKERLIEKFSDRFVCPDTLRKAREKPDLILSIHKAKSAFAKILKARSWDLVIVDECHMLKNAETENFRFVFSLRKRLCLLLSATPLHNELYDLYNLATLCRPGLLSSRRIYGQTYARHRRKPTRTERLRKLRDAVMTRTRRKDVGDQIPQVKRHVRDIPVPLRRDELACHSEVFHFIRDWCAKYFRESVRLGEKKQDAVLQMVLELIRVLQMISSTKRAVAGTLDGVVRARVREAARLTGDVKDLGRLDQILERVRKCRFDGKVARLCADIRTYLKQGQVIVFTTWLASKDVIRDALRARGLRVVEFYGEMPPADKKVMPKLFRKSDVLVSTETGGEGLDLQFANVVVNFDLPWNPMRLEQRIGRVDRIGQEKPVWVYNYYTPNAIDRYVLKILKEKLNMFREVVGEMASLFAMVAGEQGEEEEEDMEASIGRILMDSRSLEEVYRRLENLGDTLHGAWKRYKAAERLADENP